MKNVRKGKRKSMKVVNKAKFIRSLIVLIFIIYIISLSVKALVIKYNQPEVEITYSTYYVSKGDTLWTIAENLEHNGDIREVIHTIRKDNNNMSAQLEIGQEIQLRNIY